MSQSKLASFAEAVANTMAGFLFSLIIQKALNHAYDVQMSTATASWFVFWFTIASVSRSYVIRRICNSQFWIKFWPRPEKARPRPELHLGPVTAEDACAFLNSDEGRKIIAEAIYDRRNY
jgi:hypothetical protein